MSLSELCIDNWDAVSKKTTQSLEGARTIDSFLKGLSEVFSKFSSETLSLCQKYKGKKLSSVEGTVNAAMIAIISDLELTVVEPYKNLSESVSGLHRDLSSHIKDHESTRKNLLNEASCLRKVYESSLSALKKSKESYHKAAKEAASAKPEKAAKLQEKARQADQRYGDQLVTTNDAQYKYYTEDQPRQLDRVQEWEESRIRFERDTLKELGTTVASAELPDLWRNFGDNIATCMESIDETSDMQSYAQSLASGRSAPADIQYEPAPEGPSVGAPASLSTHQDGPPPAHQAASYITPSAAPVQHEAAYDDDDAPQGNNGDDYVALYDYEATDEGEMSLTEGEHVRISEDDGSGWVYAVADDGREGYVPTSYVEKQ